MIDHDSGGSQLGGGKLLAAASPLDQASQHRRTSLSTSGVAESFLDPVIGHGVDRLRIVLVDEGPRDRRANCSTQNLHSEDLLDTPLELEQRYDLAALEIHHCYAALEPISIGAIGRSLKVADSRTLERPTNA